MCVVASTEGVELTTGEIVATSTVSGTLSTTGQSYTANNIQQSSTVDETHTRTSRFTSTGAD